MNLALKDSDFKRVSRYEKDFKHKKRLKDPRFGDISIIQSKNNKELLAVVEKKINDRKEAGRQIVNCRNRLQNKHQNILNLRDYSVKKQSELCSSFYVLRMFYEYPRSDLKREINLREKNGETLDHKELTHIMYQQISANAYLQAKDQTHGDIQPLNISYDRNKQWSKLIDKSMDKLSPKRAMNLQKNKMLGGHALYQSPKIYSNLKKKNLNFERNPAKDDVYSLGLTLLEAGNGRSVQNIYDKSTGEVNEERLNEHLNEFNQRYKGQNTLLATTVNSMVNPDENQRPDFRSLETSMPSYSEVKEYLNTNQA